MVFNMSQNLLFTGRIFATSPCLFINRSCAEQSRKGMSQVYKYTENYKRRRRASVNLRIFGGCDKRTRRSSKMDIASLLLLPPINTILGCSHVELSNDVDVDLYVNIYRTKEHSVQLCVSHCMREAEVLS